MHVYIGMTLYQVRPSQHVCIRDVSVGSGQESAAASYKCSNELLGCIKCNQFTEHLNHYETDKKRFVQRAS